MEPSLTDISVPVVAIVLVVREIGAVLQRRKNGNGHEARNDGKAVMASKIEGIDRRTEEMAMALRTLPAAIDELTRAFRSTASAVDRLIQQMEQRKR